MKTWKQGIIGNLNRAALAAKVPLLILAVMVLAFVFAACDDGKKDELCTCNPKEHYLPCTCGGTDCTCKVIPRGYTSDNVPIYQKSSDPAVDAVAGTMAESIATSYNTAAGGGVKTALSGKIKEIWIVKKAENQEWLLDYTIVDGKVILKFQYDNQYIEETFGEFAFNILPKLGLSNG